MFGWWLVLPHISQSTAVCIVLLSNRRRAPANNNDVSCGCCADASATAAAAVASSAAVQMHRCLFVLTPPAPRNFNKSLSKTSTFALGLQCVSRRFRVSTRGPSRAVWRALLLLLLLQRLPLLRRRDEVVLISATLALQLIDLPSALRCPSTSERERAIESTTQPSHTVLHDARSVSWRRNAFHLKVELMTLLAPDCSSFDNKLMIFKNARIFGKKYLLQWTS